MKITKLIKITKGGRRAWVQLEDGTLIKKRLSSIPPELLKATPEPQKATPEPLEVEMGVIAGLCLECQETGKHKIWCSKSRIKTDKLHAYLKDGTPIALRDLEAEKELDTTYGEEMREIEELLKKAQDL